MLGERNSDAAQYATFNELYASEDESARRVKQRVEYQSLNTCHNNVNSDVDNMNNIRHIVSNDIDHVPTVTNECNNSFVSSIIKAKPSKATSRSIKKFTLDNTNSEKRIKKSKNKVTPSVSRGSSKGMDIRIFFSPASLPYTSNKNQSSLASKNIIIDLTDDITDDTITVKGGDLLSHVQCYDIKKGKLFIYIY